MILIIKILLLNSHLFSYLLILPRRAKWIAFDTQGEKKDAHKKYIKWKPIDDFLFGNLTRVAQDLLHYFEIT